MRVFYLLILLFLLTGCNRGNWEKTVRLKQELATSPILSERFDSLLQEARKLPNKNHLSVLLTISDRKDESIDGFLKQESLLEEALPLASKKERKKILLYLIDHYIRVSYSRNFPFALEKGIMRCEELENNYPLSLEERWKVLETKGALLMNEGKIDKSLPHFYELLSEHRVEEKFQLVVKDLAAIGGHYSALGDDKKSISLYQEAYQLAVDKQLPDLQEECFNLLFSGLLDSGHYAEAITYYKRNKLNSNLSLTSALSYNLAICYKEINHPDTARFYLEKNLGLISQKKNKAELYARIAETYILENREDSASFFLNKAMTCFQERADRIKQSDGNMDVFFPGCFRPIYTDFARLLERNGKPQKALEVYRLIEPLMKVETKEEVVLKSQSASLAHLSSFYRNTGHYKEALDALIHSDSLRQISVEMRKRLDSENIIDRFKSQELIYTIDVQKAQLTYSHRILIVVGASVLLLCCSIVILLVLYRQRRKQLAVIFEKDLQIQQFKTTLSVSKEVPNQMEKLFQAAEDKIFKEKLFLNKVLSLHMLARELNTNRSYLSSCINYCSDGNFNQWVNNYRIRYVLEHIHSTRNISELADDAGFLSLETFYRNFKRYTNLTPSQYLKQNMPE